MKEPVKFGIILLVFCALSAGLLAAVNSFTAPVIAETELKNTLASYEVILVMLPIVLKNTIKLN